ncbi:glycosyltransferase [Algoriphagus sp.]|uniref:glycosyltransferase n=1 Tax=Algoriphagus sp. TaxID=1872435 RepID=UPI003F6E6F96
MENKKAKLAILTTDSLECSYGGISPFVKNLDKGLSEHFELSYYHLPSWMDNMRWVSHRVLHGIYTFINLPRIRKADYILSHSPESSYVSLLSGKKVFHIYHGNANPMTVSRFKIGKFFAGIYDRMNTQIEKNTAKCFTVGEKMKGRDKIVNPVIHTVKPKPVEERNGFIFAGRLEVMKRVHKVIEVYHHLNEETKKIHKLYILGSGTLNESIRKFAVELGENQNVIFIPQIDNLELIEFCSNRKAMLMASSLGEGFPMAIAEALSVGVPAISTAVGDIPSYIKDGYNGYLLPMDFEPKQYVDKIYSLLENYPPFAEGALESSYIFNADSVANWLALQIKNADDLAVPQVEALC